jgi:hypothetical protein
MVNGLLPPKNSIYNFVFTGLKIQGESKMLWARMVAYVTGTVNSRTPVAERISWGREPDPERSDQGSTAAFGR